VTPRNTTVQRITQVVHPVGRGKKKELLAHVIQEHDWSQVLVFTRTKFGANSVADFLVKKGITAMALHGNKSQTAARRRSPASRAATSAPWWPPTSPRAASTSTTCRTW
jgi:superfamily II DNA/RNA helicase